MLSPTTPGISPQIDSFRHDVTFGLQQSQKQIPCKYLYDELGSALFDQICELDEYYVTRTETEIMRMHADEIGAAVGGEVRLVEFGSGSSVKTRLLLDNLPDAVAYIPVDISEKHLLSTAQRLQGEYAQLEVLPVVADFTQSFALPPLNHKNSLKSHGQSKPLPKRTTIYFPGSTIGNFSTEHATQLLARIADMCQAGDGLLIGVDLQKDVGVLERAYNDSAGITAAFNRNLLQRMRTELGAELDLSGFEHHAFYNAQQGRIESYLRSLRPQAIQIDAWRFELDAGELIHTEYSYKYTIDGFRKLAEGVGLSLANVWTDARDYFAVLYFTRAAC